MIGALGLAMMGCGDNHQTCGEGTHEDNGVCLPDGTGATCGQGTVMDVSGECVPSDEVCAEGTVFVEGECVPEDDTLTADLEEEAEPNDGFEKTDGVAGSIALEDVGDGTSFHGCITPYRDLDASGTDDVDYDMWLVTVEEPSLIDVTADGVRGLSAGFLWIPAGTTTIPLSEAGWARYGINLATDTSSRQVYLPMAGVYALVMSDSRALFLDDGAAGSNDETCYYTSIEKVAIPTPTAVTADVAVNGTVGGDTLFYSYNPSEGDLLDVVHEITSAAASPSIVALVDDVFFRYGEPSSVLGALADADDITLVVEPVYNYAQVPVDFSLTVNPLRTDALPLNGTTANGTASLNEASTWETLDDITWMWFDVGANEVVHFDMEFTSGDPAFCKGPCFYNLNLAFLDQDLNFVGDSLAEDFFFGENYTDGFVGWARFPAAGRYYVGFFPPNLDAGEQFEVTSTVTRVVPGATTLGTPVTGAAYSDLGRAWRNLDGGTSIWMGMDAAATGFGGTVQLRFYDPEATGVLDLDIPFLSGRNLPSNGSADGFVGQITFGQPNDFLVGIRDSAGTATAAATYDLSIANRVYDDLGTITTTTPIDLATETSTLWSDPPGGALYFVRAAANQSMTITVTPASDEALELVVLDRREQAVDGSYSGVAGEAQTVSVLVPTDGFVAFRVANDGLGDPTFVLAIDLVDPCAGGSIVPVVATDIYPANDEGVSAGQTLPFDFTLFGDTVTSYWISTNGFISFGPSPGNAFYNYQPFPTDSNPDGVIAPWWSDLENVSICKITGANQVTIRWLHGDDFSALVDFEMVLHDDDTIDFNYGPDHGATGLNASIGAEDRTGEEGRSYGFRTAGSAVDRTFNTNVAL